jgi:poly(hydroxyalkanoate) depolymerase family esterase
MSKTLTKLWLRGLRRLVANQFETPRAPKARAPSKTVRPKAPQRLKPGAATAQARAKVAAASRESRVGPRTSAWASGVWSRSFHSAPPAAGRFINHLSYALYMPSGVPRTRMPLVVMLHGCKQSAEELAQGTRINLLADRFGFAVLYPEQSKTAHVHRCWRWYDRSADGGGGEAAAVVSLVKAMLAEHDFDPERIYLAGMSAGAGLAAMLAVEYPTLFAAVGLHSGVVFGDASSAVGAMDVMRRGSRKDSVALIDAAVDVAQYPGMPAIIMHGELDSVVSNANAQQLTTQFLRLNGFVDAKGAWRSGEMREEKQDDSVIRDFVKGGRRVVRSAIARGLGHAWSGGDDTVQFHSSKGPDASALLWEFFKHQKRYARPFAMTRSCDTML